VRASPGLARVSGPVRISNDAPRGRHWRLRVGTDSLDSQARPRELGLTGLGTF